MAAKFTGSTIAVALVAAAVGAGITLAVDANRRPTSTPGGSHAGRQTRLQRHLAGAQRSALGSPGPRGATGRGHAAGRLSVRVRARGRGACAGARRRRRRSRLGRRRRRRRSDPVQAGGGEGQEGERRELDRPRSGAEVLSARASRARCTCPTRSRSSRAPTRSIWRSPSRAPRRTIHLDKVEGPPDLTYMGHSVGRWEGDTLVVDVTEFNGKNWFDRAGNFHSDAMRSDRAFHADHEGRHPLRGDDRGSERVHPAVEDLDAALSAAGAEHAADGIPLHRVRRGVPVRRPSQEAAGHALGRRDDDRRHQAEGS